MLRRLIVKVPLFRRLEPREILILISKLKYVIKATHINNKDQIVFGE